MKVRSILSLALCITLLGFAAPAFAQTGGAGGGTAGDGGAVAGMNGGGGGDNNDAIGGTPLKIPKRTDLFLLQPLDDSTNSLSAKPGIQIFFDYFNLSWPWILGVCAGLAVLQAMIGGMQMMMSGGGAGRDLGKERMMWATAGLLIIALAGMILSTINPLFYA